MEARICQIVDVYLSKSAVLLLCALFGRSKLRGCLDAGEWILLGLAPPRDRHSLVLLPQATVV